MKALAVRVLIEAWGSMLIARWNFLFGQNGNGQPDYQIAKSFSFFEEPSAFGKKGINDQFSVLCVTVLEFKIDWKSIGCDRIAKIADRVWRDGGDGNLDTIRKRKRIRITDFNARRFGIHLRAGMGAYQPNGDRRDVHATPRLFLDGNLGALLFGADFFGANFFRADFFGLGLDDSYFFLGHERSSVCFPMGGFRPVVFKL